MPWTQIAARQPAEPRLVRQVRIGGERVPALDSEAGVPCAGDQIQRHEQHADEEQRGESDGPGHRS